MGYLQIELARTIDEDRFREAEHSRHMNEAPAMRDKQSTNPVRSLVRSALSLVKLGQLVAAEPAR
jgi:hypothetical protein